MKSIIPINDKMYPLQTNVRTALIIESFAYENIVREREWVWGKDINIGLDLNLHLELVNLGLTNTSHMPI